MRCVGDLTGWHPPECNGEAVVLVRQVEECPPDCTHPLSQACWDYAQEHMRPVVALEATPIIPLI